MASICHAELRLAYNYRKNRNYGSAEYRTNFWGGGFGADPTAILALPVLRLRQHARLVCVALRRCIFPRATHVTERAAWHHGRNSCARRLTNSFFRGAFLRRFSMTFAGLSSRFRCARGAPAVPAALLRLSFAHTVAAAPLAAATSVRLMESVHDDDARERARARAARLTTAQASKARCCAVMQHARCSVCCCCLCPAWSATCLVRRAEDMHSSRKRTAAAFVVSLCARASSIVVRRAS